MEINTFEANKKKQCLATFSHMIESKSGKVVGSSMVCTSLGERPFLFLS